MIIEILRIKYPRTFGCSKSFFTIDEVREIVKLVETKSYIFHPKAQTITATIDISDDIKFNEFYGISDIKNKAVATPIKDIELK